MKKIKLIQFIFTLFILSSLNIKAQSEVFQYQKESFSKNSETDYSKGKTNVGVPLFNVPTSKSNLNINVALSYNTDNVSIHSMVSDVGLGWNVMAGGVITKYMTFGLNDNTNNIYQYNFPGKSGRFYIKYDNSTGDIKAVEDYPSNNKIIIQKQSDLVFTSFKIIDEKGFKYIFDKRNISYRYEYSNPLSSPIGHGQGIINPAKKELYNSAFYLTKILDERDNIIVDYEYDVSTRTITTDGKQIVKNKLSKINITNVGSIIYNYFKQPLEESSAGENYLLLDIILKNKSNQIINQYNFQYTSSIITGRTFLDHIIQKDKNNNELGTHRFSYHDPGIYPSNNVITYDKYGFVNTFDPCHIDYDNFYSFKSINADAYKTDFLKSITFPTGGKIEYEYEPNTYDITPYTATYNTAPDDFSDFEIEKLSEINFDTQITNLYPFTINNPGNYSKFLIKISHSFPDQTHYPHPSYQFNWDIRKSGTNNIISLTDYINSITLEPCDFVKELGIGNDTNFTLKVGVYVYGKAEIFGVKKVSRNFRYAKGGRIKNIKTYENNSSSSIKVLNFSYDLFSDSTKTSGATYLDVPEYDVPYINGIVTSEGDDFRRDQEMIMYKNVKVTDSIKNTSTKYTFLMPEEIDADFGTNLNSEIFSFDYNNSLKKMGLPKKIESFDSNNQLVEKNENVDNLEYIVNNNMTDAWSQPLKTLWIKSTVNNTMITVNGSNTVQSSQQKFYDSGSNLLTKQISTDFSGTVTQSNIFYPKDLNNQKLLTANITGIPLRSEIIQDNQLVSKSETKFDDPATVYPTSQITYNMQTQAAQSVGSIESYDELGNVREVKSKNGVSTVTIWGYHKTQPIAVIIGLTYAQVQNLAVVNAAVEASNQDNDNSANEPALIAALDNLRKDDALKGYQITTFTYDPLIGITSTTLPTGMKEINIYDNANRLLKVTDANGKTLKEFKYNYKNQ